MEGESRRIVVSWKHGVVAIRETRESRGGS